MRDINLNKFFPVDKDKLFKYFSQKDLVEKWQAPTGMTLKLPQFEARAGGSYRYEHTGQDGLYVCEGNFKEFVPGERIIQFDRFIRDPKGKNIFENLQTTIDFQEKAGGTEVRIRQTGFTTDEQAKMCQDGWDQSFELLSQLVMPEAGIPRGRQASGGEREIRS